MVANVLKVKAKAPRLRLPVSLAGSSRCGPGAGVSSGESAHWCGRGPGRVRRHLGQLGMGLRELVMAETTAFGVGVDPARSPWPPDGYCRAPAATATNRSPFRNLGSGTGLPARPAWTPGPLPWSSRTPGESAATSGSHALASLRRTDARLPGFAVERRPVGKEPRHLAAWAATPVREAGRRLRARW